MDQLEQILWKIMCVTVHLAPSLCISRKKRWPVFLPAAKGREISKSGGSSTVWFEKQTTCIAREVWRGDSLRSVESAVGMGRCLC